MGEIRTECPGWGIPMHNEMVQLMMRMLDINVDLLGETVV